MARICVTPAVEGLGGVTSFRLKFEAALRAQGIEVTHDPSLRADAVLVVGGTRDVIPLWRAKRRGLRLAQRLDGINWVHRQRRTGIRHYLRAEYGNFILSSIRKYIATHILYQSRFCKDWWNGWYGVHPTPSAIVHNGVDLDLFYPEGSDSRPQDRYRILVVEGNLGGGYEMGLENAIELANLLHLRHNLPIELMAVGRIGEAQRTGAQSRSQVPILWAGEAPREKIPEIDRSAHLLFSADLNPACPNSVIEALACGLPVAAFDTGALNELVTGEAGRVVPYGGDPWKIDRPDLPALAEAAAEILRDQARFRKAARARAVAAFNVEYMVERYLDVLLG